MKGMETAKLDKDVMRGIRAIWELGITNLMDPRTMANTAKTLGWYAAAEWLKKNPQLYFTILRENEVAL